MSSPSGPIDSDLVVTGDHARGPVASPIEHTDEFIEQFNRIYASIGLRIDRVAREPVRFDVETAKDQTSPVQVDAQDR